MATVTSSQRKLTHTSNTYESNGDVTIGGNLNINGTTTTIDTANLLVEDKNIIIGDVSSPTDTTADGGGITLKGASDKTINWINSTSSWTSNQTFSAPNLTLTNLSNQSSEATALVVNGSNVVGYRELSTSAFVDSSEFASASHVSATNNPHSVTASQVGAYTSAETDTLLSAKAPLASPSFSGTPTAPTTSSAENSTKIATTAYVKSQGYITSASGGNAATLDGIDSTSFLRSDASDSFSGKLTGTNANENLEVGGIRGTTKGSQTGDYIHLYERVHIGGPSGWGHSTHGAPSNGLGVWGAIDLGMGGSGALQVDGTTVLTNARVLQNVTAAAGIITSGTFADARIPSLAASKITSGNLDNARMPTHVDIGGKLDIGVSTNYGTTTNADKLWISQFDTGQSDVPGSYYDIINLSSGSSHGIQIASNYGASSGGIYIRTRSDNSSAPAGQGLQAWNKLWHNNNDGSGSGLDADLLDGQHASAFQAAGTYNTIIGTDSDINTSGSTIIDNIYVTDGVITSMGTRALTLADLGYTGATNANNYSLPAASSSTRGGVKIGYSENGKNYPVEVSSEKMFVNVPWTDNNTTYSAGNGISLSSTTFSVAAGGGLTQTSTGLSHSDTSSQASVNNSNGTVIQDITLDTYGHITSLGSTNLDSRYFTEDEVNTYFKRGYSNQTVEASSLTSGAWYTIAQNTGDRAIARFGLRDGNSGDHQSVIFYAAHHFGVNASSTITVLHNSYFGGSPFRYIRIKDGGTYDGAVLQVYVDGEYGGGSISAYLLGDDFQIDGWDLVDWLTDATAPSNVSNYSIFGESSKIDLDQIAQGGIATTGPIYGDGDTTQYRMFNDNYHPNADKLTTARNIALTGAVTGNANFDGSGNISIATTATADPTLTLSGDVSGAATFTNLGNATLAVTVADDSHNHIISNVDGLQSALDAKQASGTYNTIIGTDSDINTSGSTIVDNIYVTDGVITSMGTRTLTLADLGYTGATNANNYSLPLAASGTRGGVKIGYAENGKNYPVEINSSEQMFVNVPWSDTNTTYSVGDGGLTQKNFTTTLKTKLDGIATNANNYVLPTTLSGNRTIGGDLTVSGNQVITAGSNADVKFSVWNGTTYGIGMTSGVTYGGLNDYAMTFCMNNDTDRGFWWGYSGQTKSTGAMSLTTAGVLTVASSITAGGAVTGSNLNISNWDAAYGWGNHASAGYSTTDTNTTYTAGRGLDLSGTQFLLETDLRDSISLIGLDSNDYLQWSNNSYLRSVVAGTERFRVNTVGIDVTGTATANAFRTDTSSTDYSIINRNTAATNYVMYVQAAQSGSTQSIASFRYGSATPNQGSEVLAIKRGSSYFSNTKLGVGTTNPRTALEVEGTITHKVYSASSLPSASPAGQRAFISDSAYGLATAIGAVVSGGGSNTIPVYSDGSSWRAG